MIGHNHDEENLVEARIWESLQELNLSMVHSGTNSQISWGGGKICYDVGTKFLLHRHAKRFVSASTIEFNNIHVLN